MRRRQEIRGRFDVPGTDLPGRFPSAVVPRSLFLLRLVQVQGGGEGGWIDGVVQIRVTRGGGLTLAERMVARRRFRGWCEYGSMRWRSGVAAGK